LNNQIAEGNFPVEDFGQIKQKVLNWLKRFNTFCFLDNHRYHVEPHIEECLVAAGARRIISSSDPGALSFLQQFIDARKSWLFGHLSYELPVSGFSVLRSQPDPIGFPLLSFFEPLVLVRINENALVIEAEDPNAVYNEIVSSGINDESLHSLPVISSRISREEYIQTVKQLQKHILRGDCYEINFCQEFFSENAQVDPAAVYRKLAEISPNPFSAFYRQGNQWLVCASPERYLMKKGNTVLSQPIKGTSRRNNDQEADEASRDQLRHSSKDRSENVMIVDLVRNDLSRFCVEGSVRVDELYGIYSFPQVHQMISTVSGAVLQDVPFVNMIEATFPPGSMTGAPKKRVLELINQYEKLSRGIFSGTVGYIHPSGDFDLNVVIRSVMYNSATGYLSYQVGSGITFYSDPEKEWEECLLKAEAINSVLLEM
jgi:para-aminobenzoate synthetase component 1